MKPLRKIRKKPTLEQRLKREIRDWNPYCQECDIEICADEKGLIRILYCSRCGVELIQPKLCEICGNPIQGSSVFCAGCGVKALRMFPDKPILQAVK